MKIIRRASERIVRVLTWNFGTDPAASTGMVCGFKEGCSAGV